MTKTAIIEYNEADESLLQLLFQKLRVQFKQTKDVLDDEDEELLIALESLETLPNNTPYSVSETKHILDELKQMA